MVPAMPTFDGRGLVPPAPPAVLETTTPVNVSLGNSREGEEEEEDEEHDSQATPERTGETSPLCKVEFLRTMPDDDDDDDAPGDERATRGRRSLASQAQPPEGDFGRGSDEEQVVADPSGRSCYPNATRSRHQPIDHSFFCS